MQGYIEIGVSALILIGTIVLCRFISKFIKVGFFDKEISVPIDTFVSRGIELLNSIPRLLLIITVAAVQKEPNLMTIMVIIGLTSWTGIARFTRAELLRIRNLSKHIKFNITKTINTYNNNNNNIYNLKKYK